MTTQENWARMVGRTTESGRHDEAGRKGMVGRYVGKQEEGQWR
jgi:hypothetical protein